MSRAKEDHGLSHSNARSRRRGRRLRASADLPRLGGPARRLSAAIVADPPAANTPNTLCAVAALRCGCAGRRKTRRRGARELRRSNPLRETAKILELAVSPAGAISLA
ncbi:hypothetical protein CISG_00775 [Coccidioides immitis RMSCC 3703]|uniref:Uncharacterized protein n=2 Tax=Coccidioides immitis TaxID=5501 RepID=A0A0J8QQR6_COCIT|nr:hypothetical protein CIRG_03556 [Coccidioides immitis RMSCC 2394]KMU74846.1 hypothetical protein CISG_00775 [Coccidioides immitis RMSCC 3703]